MIENSNMIYGWFDSAGQTVPAYDPPHDAECPYCGEPCTPTDVRTHSLLIEGADERSYFYRTHRTCDERSRANNMDGSVIDRILADREREGKHGRER